MALMPHCFPVLFWNHSIYLYSVAYCVYGPSLFQDYFSFVGRKKNIYAKKMHPSFYPSARQNHSFRKPTVSFTKPTLANIPLSE